MTDFEPIDDDDTGITVAPRGAAAPRPARKDVVRIGRFAVPSLAAAAALSVTAHAAIIALAVAAVWAYSRGRAPDRPWGGGTNGGAVAVGVDAADAPTQSALPPAPEERPAAKLQTSRGERDYATDQPPQWTGERVSLTATLDGEQSDSQIIGIRGLAAESGPRPRPNAGNKSFAPGAIDANASNQSEVAGRTSPAGPSNGPGLPGAVGAAGLPAPSYPPEAMRRGQQGVVKVAIEVLPDGKVGEIRVFKQSGYPLLDRAAVTAAGKLRAFQFIPARRFGVAVKDSLIIPYAFELR